MDNAAFQAALAGQIISRLVALEYWCGGQLSDPFNVLYVAVDHQWLRFFIDASVFFWRVEAVPDLPMADEPFAWTLAEYPFAGRVEDVVFSSAAADVLSLHIVLSGGRALCLYNEADHTTVTFLPPNHPSQRTALPLLSFGR